MERKWRDKEDEMDEGRCVFRKMERKWRDKEDEMDEGR